MAHNSLGNISLPLIGNPYVFFVKASSASDVICSSQFKHLQPVPSGCGFGLFPISPIIQRPVISSMEIMKILKRQIISFLGINSLELKWVTSSNRTFYRQIKLGPKAYLNAEYSTLFVVRTIKHFHL